MARGAGILAFMASAALGYGAGHASLVLTSDELRAAQPVSIKRELAALEAAPVQAEAAPWPALFGTYVPPAEPVAAAPEPEPQPEPLPPMAYELVGLISGGDAALSWAIVRDAGVEHLVRPGDTLPGGEEILAIDSLGVWVSRAGERAVISFVQGDENLFARLLLQGDAVQDTALADQGAGGVLTEFGVIKMTVPAGQSGEAFPQIISVNEGQLFDLIGLMRGDWVLSINGHMVNDPEVLEMAAQLLADHERFKVEILRGGETVTISVKISG